MSTAFTDLVAAIKACTAACTIALAPGNYGQLALRGLHPDQPVTVDLTGSTFTFGYVPASSNLILIGGTVTGGNQWGFCWVVDGSTNVEIRGATAQSCPTASFMLTRSKNVSLTDWKAVTPGCDGVQVTGTDGFTVSGGSYTGYVPNPNGCHADGVQMWSMPGYPLQNGTIINNTIISTAAPDPGNTRSLGTQGIDNFGDKGPTSNITVTGNTLILHGNWCFSLVNISGLTFKNNRCKDARPEPWRSKSNTAGSTPR
jgi:hypothetical protein